MERIWHYLAERSVEYADRVEAVVRAGVERLVDFPEMGRPRGDGGRDLLLSRIQYRIGYFVSDDRIVIATVRSTREAA